MTDREEILQDESETVGRKITNVGERAERPNDKGIE